MSSKIVVAIPCFNEAATIAQVVKDFKRALPNAEIYVFNNNSTDNSVPLAKEAGAIVRDVHRRGKGNVMRTILDQIRADALIIVDGDGTYSAEEAALLLEPILSGQVDMVVGNRLENADKKSLNELNKFGNHLIVNTINFIFGTSFKDILSGYRVLSRRCIETIPLLTSGFETETELTLQVLEEGLEAVEIPISYRPRPSHSPSKLHPLRDGLRIFITIAMILRDHHPLRIYGFLGILLFLISFVAMILKILIPHGVAIFSSTFLAGIILVCAPMGTILIGIGFILSAINTRLRELKQIVYRNR